MEWCVEIGSHRFDKHSYAVIVRNTPQGQIVQLTNFEYRYEKFLNTTEVDNQGFARLCDLHKNCLAINWNYFHRPKNLDHSVSLVCETGYKKSMGERKYPSGGESLEH